MHATQDAMAFHKLFRYQILKWGSHSGDSEVIHAVQDL